MNDFLMALPVLVAWIAASAWVIRQFAPRERSLLWIAFLAHQLTGVTMILVTQFYYGGDMIAYYRFGVVSAKFLRDDFLGLAPSFIGMFLHRTEPLPIPLATLAGSSTGTMQAFSALSMVLFNDSLYATCCAISGFAFIGKVMIFSVARIELPDVPRGRLLFACALVPSAVFWSGALLKEPLAMMGLSAAVFGWHRLLNGANKFSAVLLVLLGSAAMLLIKGYIFPVFGIAAAVWYWLRGVRTRRADIALTLGQIILAGAIAGAAVLGTGAILPMFAVDNIESAASSAQAATARAPGGSTYELGDGTAEESLQLSTLPVGLVSSLFRPFIFEAKNAFMFFSALEMTVITVLSLMCLFRWGPRGLLGELMRRPFLGFCATLVLLLAAGVGLTTANLGTLARYRMPMMPFFAILLCVLAPKAKRVAGTVTRRVPALPSGAPSLQ